MFRALFAPRLPAGAPSSHAQLGKPAAWWAYHNGTGQPVAVVYRFDTGEGKEYRPYDLVTGRWGAPTWRPLYRLPSIAASRDRVILVEGEKCADALARFGLVATTGSGGANGIGKTDLSPLKGRDVIIWPDADAAGARYAKDGGEALRNVGAASVRVAPIDTTSLRNVAERTGAPHVTLHTGWDVADAVQAGWGQEALYRLLDEAQPYIAYIDGLGCGQGGRPAPYIAMPDDLAAHARPTVDKSKDDIAPWPTLDRSVLQERPPAPPFPTDVFGPRWEEWLLRRAEETAAPVDFTAGSLLASAAALIGNARWVQPWPRWQEPPALWVALVGKPSSGKSPAMGPVLEALRDLESELLPGHDEALREFETKSAAAKIARERWQDELRTAAQLGCPPPTIPEAAQDPNRPERPRLLVSDTTTEAMAVLLASLPKGVLFSRDELAGWLGNFDRYGGNGGDRAFWIESYGGRPYAVDRKKQDGRPILIPHLTMGVLGGIQPDRLTNLLLRGDDDGLTARFLYFWPDPVPFRRPCGDAGDDMASGAFRRLMALKMAATDDGGYRPLPVPFAEAAASHLESWYSALCETEAHGRFAGWMGKARGFAARLSLVIEYLRWAGGHGQEPESVSPSSLVAAIRLFDNYLTPMARRTYGEAGLSDTEQHAATIARWIERKRPLTVNVRELQRMPGLPGLDKAEAIRAALDYLTEAGWLRPTYTRHGATHGRKARNYEINPAIGARTACDISDISDKGAPHLGTVFNVTNVIRGQSRRLDI